MSERDRPGGVPAATRPHRARSSRRCMVTVDGPVDAALPVQEPPRPLHGAVRLPQPAQAAGPRASCRSAAATTRSTTAGLGDRLTPSGVGRGAGDADALRRRAGNGRCGCRPRAGAAGAAASASSRCSTAPSTCRRRPPSRSSCASRSGWPARRSSPTPRPPSTSRSCAAGCASSAPEPTDAARRRSIPSSASSTASSTTATRRSSRCATGVYGIAIDVGTTTVVLELVDLLDGRTVEVVALENPQRFGGSDVMNRISYDEADEAASCGRRCASALNRELQELYERRGIDRREVYEVVVVGNATMRDLFFGLDVAPIGQRPYKSVTELELLRGRRDDDGADRARPRARRARAPAGARLGRAADREPRRRRRRRRPRSPIGLDGTQDGVRMLVDVGTNTEVVLGGPRPHPRRELPGRPRLRGRRGHLRHAGRRRRDRVAAGRRPTARFASTHDRRRAAASGSAAPG